MTGKLSFVYKGPLENLVGISIPGECRVGRVGRGRHDIVKFSIRYKDTQGRLDAQAKLTKFREEIEKLSV